MAEEASREPAAFLLVELAPAEETVTETPAPAPEEPEAPGVEAVAVPVVMMGAVGVAVALGARGEPAGGLQADPSAMVYTPGTTFQQPFVEMPIRYVTKNGEREIYCINFDCLFGRILKETKEG